MTGDDEKASRVPRGDVDDEGDEDAEDDHEDDEEAAGGSQEDVEDEWDD